MKSSVTNRKQRFWALLLAVVMVVGLLPTAGVNAASYDMADADLNSFTVNSTVLVAGDTINNTNIGTGANGVEIDYYGTDGTTLLGSQTISGASNDTVKSYSAYYTLPAGTATKPEKWLVFNKELYSSTSYAGCGNLSRIFVKAIPTYTLIWDIPASATVTFADGSALPTSYTAGDAEINVVATNFKATRPGFTFSGWKVGTTTVGSADNKTQTLDGTTVARFDTYDSNAAVAAAEDFSITFVAQWTRKTNYTITFDNNVPAGTTDGTPQITGIGRFEMISGTYYSVNVNLPTAPVANDVNNNPYDHYTFEGWSVNASPTPSTTPYPAGSTAKVDDLLKELGSDDSTIPMIGNWTGKQYYINYSLAAGGAPAPTSGVAVPTQSPKKEYGKDSFDIETMADTSDYVFKGWSFDAKGAKNTIDLATIPSTQTVKAVRDSYETVTGTKVYGSGNIEVYGVWNPIYTVTYYGNGDDANSSVPLKAESGDTIQLSKNSSSTEKVYFERTGYHIKGWNTRADGKGDHLALGDNVLILGNKDFYAEWDSNTYTVVFDANTTDPVTGTMTPQGFTYGAAALALSANQFVRTGYTFTGWATTPTGAVAYTDGQAVKDLTNVNNGTVTLYAVWQKNTYTITWNDGDGNSLGTTTVAYGDTPTYTLTTTPTKKATASDTYTFDGTWTPALTVVTGNATYTANFSKSAVSYIITWNDGDGNSLGTTTVAYGDTPVYTLAATPTKTATGGAIYLFNNTWTPAITPATGNTTYTANFTQTIKNYTITWKDGDGNTLGTSTVAYGTVPAYTLAATPTKKATASETYTFDGTWTPALAAVSGDATYTANFSKSAVNYTITWKDGDGNTLGTSTVAYGTLPAYTLAATPTKKADATNTYTFNNSWSPAIVAVTGDAIYTAQFAGTAKPTGTSPAPTGTSPTPAIVTPTATPTPAVVTPTATPTPDPNGDGGNGGQGTPVEEKIYDIKYFEVDDDGNEIELKNTGNPKTYKYGEGAVIDKKLDREGYVFLGWFTKDGTKPVTKISKKAKGTKKLYARYEAIPEDDGTGDGNDNINGNPSDFSTLFVRLTNYTENSMTLTWEAMEYIDGYDIFGSRCNSKDVIRPYEPIASVGTDVTEYVMSDLLAKTYYKFYVRAYILVNNEKRYITTSINVHGVTLNDTYGVADEINIDKVVTKSGKKSRTKYNRTKDGDVEEINITMKVGQTLTIVTSEYNADGKEIRAHRPISFESSNPNICKVGKKNSHKYGVTVAGKANTYKSRTITAKAAGECTIWVFAQNGIYTKVNVKVKPVD